MIASYFFGGVILLGFAAVYFSVISLALYLFILLVLTGGVWLLDRFMLRAKRGAGVHEPWWVEYAKSFFPVILIVFLLRSFLVEPFKIPSGSMIPTLHVGDFILVNRFTYGLRLPIVNKKFVEISQPQRGDVMVFHYPGNPSVDYIKRVIGLPGDVLVYQNKKLSINGVEQELVRGDDYNYVKSELQFVHTERYTENLGGKKHAVILNPERPQLQLTNVENFPQHEQCSYSEKEVRCTVPAGHYFMMGDNRDDSRDSRYWGFVPDEMIVGKAFFIWMNLGDFGRIGTLIK